MSQDVLTSFFGWMAALNIAILVLGAGVMLVLKDRAAALHARWFNLDDAVVRQTMYSVLGSFKVMALIFSIVPYLALRLM